LAGQQPMGIGGLGGGRPARLFPLVATPPSAVQVPDGEFSILARLAFPARRCRRNTLKIFVYFVTRREPPTMNSRRCDTVTTAFP
jgi:hypothetical protein